ncbi:MAG: 3D domain-containing protein [candidate division Zixibacteria bacterium]|nr:3D domain-containing protein [candidate division Zixibacteria bacterium]
MRIKKMGMVGIITLMILILSFFTSQNVQKSAPVVNFLNDQLLEVINSLQKELTVYKDRERMFLKHINYEEYIVTAYLPIDSAEGRYSGLTASRAVAKPYFTVAVDPTVVPINSWIWIEGLGWWKAQDTGDAIRGQKIDLCLSIREETKKLGRRKMRIKILK